MKLRALLALPVVAACAAASLRGVVPPDALPPDAPDGAFSAARAMRIVRELARAPHPVGSPENARVRDAVVGMFRERGLEPEVRTSWQAGQRVLAPVSNIVAILPGSGGSGGASLLLCAHYDSVATGPGAADDVSGVAVLLETLRALRAGPPLANDVIFLLTDGEEGGLLGATAFVEAMAAGNRLSEVGAVLNFEARGHRGASLLFETSGDGAWLIREFAAVATDPATDSLSEAVYEMLPNDTDLSVFDDLGLSGLNFAFIGGVDHYHTMLDTPENLDGRSLQHHGDQALALARRLGDADLAAAADRGGPAVWFSLFRAFVVGYGAVVAWAVAVLAALLAAAAAWQRRAELLRGIWRLALGIGVGGVLAALMQLALSGPLSASAGIEAAVLYEPAWLAAGATAWAIAAVGRQAAHDEWGTPLLLAATLLFAAAGVAAMFLIPGGSFLFAWPALFGALALLAARGSWWRWTIASLPAVALLAQYPPMMFEAFAFDGTVACAVMAAFVAAFAAPILWLCANAWGAKRLIFVLVGAGALSCAWGLLNARYDETQPRPSSVMHVSTVGEQGAWLVSPDRRLRGDAKELLGSMVFEVSDDEPSTTLWMLHARWKAMANGADLAPVEVEEPRFDGRRASVRCHPPVGCALVAVQAVRHAFWIESSDGARLTDGKRSFLWIEAPPEQFDVAVEAASGDDVELVITAVHTGLPAPMGGIIQRPPDVMPQRNLPDSSLVERRVVFTMR